MPDAPSTSRVSPLHELLPEGPVSGGVPFRLYYLAAATSASGRLELRGAEGGFALHFRRGTPELARADAPALDLGAFLLAKGLLDGGGLARAAAARASHGGDLLAALFALGLLAPQHAFPLLAEHGRLVLERALSLEEGTFRWEAGASMPATAFPLGGKWDLLCWAGRRLDPSTVRRRLGSRIDLPVMRAGDGLARLEDLRLTAQETRIVAGFDGIRSLAQLAAAHPAEAEAYLRTACFLADLGLASFSVAPVSGARSGTGGPAAPVAGAGGPAAPGSGAGGPGAPVSGAGGPAAPGSGAGGPAALPRRGPARGPTPPARAGGVPLPHAPPVLQPGARPAACPPPADGPELPADLEGVRAYLARLEGRDHFEVLGVPRTATLAQIKAAYFRLARAFHPDTAGIGAGAELRRLKAEITSRLNGAYRVLSDGEKRREYVEALEAGGTGQVDVGALLAAEEHFAWAMVRVKAHRFAEALPALEKAIELNPLEGEFYAWRGFARFALAPDPRAARETAMADIRRALEFSPKCAVAWLCAARIESALGQAGRAADAYRKCLALDAGQAEAQRELRILEGRGNR